MTAMPHAKIALPLSSIAPRIAVLIPCYNEAPTISRVVHAFRAELPDGVVYVYDNNSSDETARRAGDAGAVVRTEHRQGKGHVVRRMFADIDADIYVMVDGDDTYDAGSVGRLIERLREGPYDLVNGARVETGCLAYRRGHRFGNWLLSTLVGRIFGTASRDMLSGYKVMSRRFVKSFPALSTGFEIETELLVHALELNMPTAEIETPYKERPPGSASKLRTVQDGARILRAITRLVKQERPLAFFSVLATLLALVSTALAGPVVLEYWRTGEVPRLPTAVLSTGLMLSAVMCFFSGMVLDTVTRGRREMKRLAYLAFPAAS